MLLGDASQLASANGTAAAAGGAANGASSGAPYAPATAPAAPVASAAGQSQSESQSQEPGDLNLLPGGLGEIISGALKKQRSSGTVSGDQQRLMDYLQAQGVPVANVRLRGAQ